MQRADRRTSTSAKPRQSRGQFVYSQIVERILDNEYDMGDRLPTEDELARQFSVSRVTVRSALSKLRERRLVVSVQGSGNYICGLPPSETSAMLSALDAGNFENIFEFRIGLETQAAALAAQNRSEAHLERMRRTLDAREPQTESIIEWLIRCRLADLEFHEAVADASANPVVSTLVHSVGALFLMPWLSRKADIEQRLFSVTEHVFEEHTMIINAIAAKDSDMARVAMQFHLTHSQQRTRAWNTAVEQC